jgi:amino acid adenylation domain-containing protein
MPQKKQLTCFMIGEGTLVIQCAKRILEQKHHIFGMISPDEAVAHWANQKGIPCIQPTDNLIDFLNQKPFDYLFSIINFSVLPKDILVLPRQYAINYHDAPLPKYAGINATSWAIINQEKTWGVTWHIMSERIDGGEILKQTPIEMAQDETAFTLNLKCYEAAIHSFKQLIDELSCDQIVATPQKVEERSYLSRFKKSSKGCLLSWNRKAHEIEALVRALDFASSPNPLGLAKCRLGSDFVIMTKIEVLDALSTSPPGTITAIDDNGIKVATASDDVTLRQVKTIEGQTLSIPDFVTEFGLHEGYQFKEINQNLAKRIENFDALLAKHEAFWVERLATLQPITIPYITQSASPLKRQRAFRTIEIPMPTEVTNFLNKYHTTWHKSDFILVAFVAYISRIGDKPSFDIGFKDVEWQTELAGLEGLLASYKPCRITVEPENSFEKIFYAVQEQIALVKRHNTYIRDIFIRYPVLCSKPELRNALLYSVIIERVEKLDNHHKIGLGYDLSLVIQENDQKCYWFYDTAVLNDDNITRMLGQLTAFMQGIVTNSARRITEFPLLSEQERHQILVEWNNTQVNYPKDVCLHQLFEAQVERTPDAIALVFENKQLSYRELNQRANQLAHHLMNLGVKPETLIGICIERSLEMVIGLLGILKAGGAYLPLEPTYPSVRLAFMLEDAQVSVLLTQEKLIKKLLDHIEHIICLDTDWKIISLLSWENPVSGVSPKNLVYVIYTSGSTGKPKGVLVNHYNVVRLFKATKFWFHFSEQDVWTLFHSLAFDFSVWEIWGAFFYGGCLVIVPYWVSRSPQQFYELLYTEQVTILNQTPAAFQQLIRIEEPSKIFQALNLRFIIFGGETLDFNTLKHWFEQHGDEYPQLINMYGITETTVHVTYHPIKMAEIGKGSIIGYPIPDLQVYIFDNNLQPVPIGVAGEMYIGGAGLARGYLNRPELTNEKFIPNPFNNDPKARLYKTGDLARYLPNGNIEYLGRIDNQVKMRGFRIELGEIETLLNQDSTVQEAVVIAREDESSHQCLIAYVVSKLIPERLPLKTSCLVELDHQSPITLTTEDISCEGVCLEGVPQTWETGQHVRIRLSVPDVSDELCLEGCIAWHQGQRVGIQFASINPSTQVQFCQMIDNIFENQGIMKVIQRTSSAHLREILRHKLPDYMIPSSFVFLKAIPLTPNGKVDRKALPQPDGQRADLETSYLAPETEIEHKIASILQTVLHVNQVGIHDNFFELGGNSLLLVQVQEKLVEVLNREVPVLTLFQHSTISALAHYLEEESPGEQMVIKKSYDRAHKEKAAVLQFRKHHKAR